MGLFGIPNKRREPINRNPYQEETRQEPVEENTYQEPVKEPVKEETVTQQDTFSETKIKSIGGYP